MLTTLSVSNRGEVVVIAVDGPLSLDGAVRIGDQQETATTVFRNLIEENIRRGAKKIVADLVRCSGVDSSGAGTLVLCHTKVANAGGRLVLVVAPGRLLDFLKISKLITVFSTYESVEAAVESLAQSKPA